jgi:RimJ/RimL family protein N-acetyltransferase
VLVRLGQEVQEVPRGVTPPDPPLADDLIRLEPIGPEHADEMDELARDDDVRRFTYVPSAPPAGFGRRWADVYERAWADGSRAGFAIRGVDDGAFLGLGMFVSIDLEKRQGEIGYVVAPAARGRGAATRCLRLLAQWGLDELELERVELRIDVENAASARVAERAGFTRDGVLRSVSFKEGLRCDLGVWSRLRADPAPPGDRAATIAP